MDRHKWMYEIEHAEEAYVTGVQSFLKFADANRLNNGDLTICCPCADCKNLLKYSDMSPKQPGNDIDVYLAPLIDDMKTLWGDGVDVYDAYKKETFKLRAMIFCTISDFSAYGNLSGYSTKDGVNARKDMVLMGIRLQLAPEEKGSRTYLPPACYTMSKVEKKQFCQCLHDIKVPSGYSANIKKLVSMQDCKLIVEKLGEGPKCVVRSYQGYNINGYTFYTQHQDEKSTMQNSGVIVIASKMEFDRLNHDARLTIAKDSYYGVIQEIWELDYHSFTIPLFKYEYDQFDELPPFSIGIPLIDDDIANTTYLRPDHNEGLWVD
nr:hypothetical protein [Tanacetum cinerariifolium]